MIPFDALGQSLDVTLQGNGADDGCSQSIQGDDGR